MTQREKEIEDFFRSLHELQFDLKRTEERLAEAESRLTSPKSAKLDGLPTGQGIPLDTVSINLERVEKLRGQVQSKAIAFQLREIEVDKALSAITVRGWAAAQEIVRLRLIDGKSWADTTETVWGDDSAYWDNPAAAAEKARRLYRAAIKQLAALPTFPPPEDTE